MRMAVTFDTVGWQFKCEKPKVIVPLSTSIELYLVENLNRFKTYRRFDRRTNLRSSAKKSKRSLTLDATTRIKCRTTLLRV